MPLPIGDSVRACSPRAQRILRHPAVGVLVVYVIGLILRIDYTLRTHPPEAFISSDMALYMGVARKSPSRTSR